MKNVLLYCILTFSLSIFAQEKDSELPKANEEYALKKYVDAEANYRISTSNFSKKAAASYNLGNAIYKQKQISEANYFFSKAIEKAKEHPEKHNAYHNLGNTLMIQKKYEEAVEAYKNALRNNPNDEETRYNYALAKKMKKEHPDKNKDKNKDKDKNNKGKDKDKKDDKKDDKKEGDKDKNKDTSDKEGKNKEDKKDNPSKNDGKPKQIPGGISKERLENLLDAVNNEEKKIQDKVKAKEVKVKPNKTEKDW